MNWKGMNWVLIAAAASLFASVLAVIMVASYETDQQIADHAASCTVARTLLYLRGVGAGAELTAQDLLKLKADSSEKYQQRAEQAVLKDPSSSKREYLKAFESAACD